MRGNCLTYALGRWWKDGGYVVFRKSPNWWGFQTFWSPDLRTFYVFVHRGRRRWWYQLIPPLWFVGRVHRWTGKEASKETTT